MLFNSLDFAVFFPVVFVAYWFVVNKSLKAQNILLLVASYFFYACWDWRFLFLLMFSTLLDYVTGLKMEQSTHDRARKFWFWLSIGINVGFLAIFKYYNFFATSFAEAISRIGLHISPWTLQVILPVGISFYTFHGLSYVIDIYNRKIVAEKKIVDYALFVSFFPLLVAGPIERATHLLPQIKRQRTFEYSRAVDGLRQILWGLFKKIAIADTCGDYANLIFNNSTEYSGTTLILGAVMFAIQIYGDFSGYSDIALGTARLLGIELLRNFAFPYFSRDVAEFWRRWHISLSSWFRDYLYIPLGGSKGGLFLKIRNTIIIFIVSGFWHGANWTFIVWGALNALYIIPLVISNKNRSNIQIVGHGKLLPSFKDALQMLLTFSLITFAWIFFRAESLDHAFQYIRELLSGLLDANAYKQTALFIKTIGLKRILVIVAFFTIEWVGREGQFAISHIGLSWKALVRHAFYYGIILSIAWFAGKEQDFIYFQF